MAVRNRAKEAREKGRVLRAFELTAEADAIVGEIVAYLHATGHATGCTRLQAVEWALRETAKKIRKKSQPGLD